MAEEETSRVFRDENGDRLSEPDEVVLSSALTEKKEPLALSMRPADRYAPDTQFSTRRRIFEDQAEANRIRRDIIRNNFGQESASQKAQIQQRCNHLSGLGYSAIITHPLLNGAAERICTRCHKHWPASPEQIEDEQRQQQAAYLQQQVNADQIQALDILGGGTLLGVETLNDKALNWGGRTIEVLPKNDPKPLKEKSTLVSFVGRVVDRFRDWFTDLVQDSTTDQQKRLVRELIRIKGEVEGLDTTTKPSSPTQWTK
jgi:hypothetical protein